MVNTLTFKSDGSLIVPAEGNVAGGLNISADKSFNLAGWVPATKGADGTWTANGAQSNAGGVALDMLATTQYNAASATSAKTQNGYATGELAGLSVDGTGNMFANFTNGQNKVIGQVAMASFANMQGLAPTGGTNWKESFASGTAVIGTPDSGIMGNLQSQALEDSNVDLTAELVNLIKAQSNYQANAKTISTESTVMQTIIQMT